MMKPQPGQAMSKPKPPALPRRPGFFGHLLGRLRGVRPWAWVVGTAVLLLAAGGTTAGVVFAIQRWEAKQRVEATAEQWARFDKAAKQGDQEEMTAALDAIAELSPDPQCDTYRQAITTGVAPPDDSRLCHLTTILHAQKGRWPDAAREAAKRLVHEPNDWLARCIVALVAVGSGDSAAAAAQLDLLPDPTAVGPPPFALLLAHDLYLRTGRDTTPLRRFAADVVVEVIGSVGVANDPPEVKVDLIDCYLIGFGGPADEPLSPRLASGVAGVMRLADDATASDNPAVLARLGNACNRLAAGLFRLHAERQLTAEQRDGLTKEHDARTARVWAKVKGLSATTPAAYHGLAVVHVRAGRYAEAVNEVQAGLTACGNDPSLLALYTMLLKAADRTDQALAAIAQAAEADPTNVPLLLLAAETALEVRRGDVADLALRQALKVAPGHPQVIRTDARLKITSGNPHGAVQRLRELGEPAVLADPSLVRVYTRGLAEAGLGLLLPDWLAAVDKRAHAADAPLVVAAALRGLCDAPFDPDTAKSAVGLVERTLVRWPGDRDLLVARGLLFARWAEYSVPQWDVARTRGALTALERVRASMPDDPDVAALLSRVRLKGMKDAARAEKDAAPLAALRDRGGLLTPAQWTALGSVLVAAGKTESGVQALEQAAKLGPPSAEVFIALARGYHARTDTARGRELVAEARRLPRTPQDDADLLALPEPLRETP